MKYMYEEPQIQNEHLARAMAFAYDPYHNVKVMAEAQNLPKLASIIEYEGAKASSEAGYAYVDGLRVDAPDNTDLAEALAAGRGKYEPVLQAAESLGNPSIVRATEREMSGEQNAIVDAYKDKLVQMLRKNTSRLILADDDGNFIDEPETVSEDDFMQFADEAGYRKNMAQKAWYALQHSQAVQKKLIRPERPEDRPKEDSSHVLVDSILEVVAGDQAHDIGIVRESLPFISPKSLQLLRYFAASVISARDSEQGTAIESE